MKKTVKKAQCFAFGETSGFKIMEEKHMGMLSEPLSFCCLPKMQSTFVHNYTTNISSSFSVHFKFLY